MSTVTSENPRLREAIASAISNAASRTMPQETQSGIWPRAYPRSTSADFIDSKSSTFLAKCLHPDPQSRPQNIGEVFSFLATLHIPPAGRLFDPAGTEIPGALFRI